MIPVYINATAMKTLACDTAYVMRCVDGLVPPENEFLRVGKIIHKYAENRGRGMDVAEAMSSLKLSATDWKDLMGVFSAYDRHPQHAAAKTKEGKPMIELRFEIKRDPIVVGGIAYEPRFVGTIDRVNLTPHMVEIVDYKSARNWKIEDVEAKYKNDTQFMFYYTIARRFAYDIFDNPIVAEHAWQGRMAIVPTFAMLSKKPQSVARGTAFTPTNEQYEDYLDALEKVVVPMAIDIFHTRRAGKTGWFTGQCPRCDYSALCHAKNDYEYEQQLKAYTRTTYNPLTWH